jgi:hypothetical protein
MFNKVLISEKIRSNYVAIRKLWFIILMQIIAALTFLVVEQGQDVVYGMIEDIAFLDIVSVFITTCIWSLVTYIGARFLFIFSDYGISSTAVSEENENKDSLEKYRRKVQIVLPLLLALTPYLILGLAFIKVAAFRGNTSVLFYTILFTLIFGFLQFGLISLCKRLFQKAAKHIAKTNIMKPVFANKNIQVEKSIIMRNDLHATGFRDLSFQEKMVFVVPLALSTITIFIFIFDGAALARAINPLGVMILAFCSWIPVAYTVEYFEKKFIYAPVKLILLFVIIFFSFYNNNHTIRTVREDYCCFKMPNKNIVNYYDEWFNKRKNAGLDTNTIVFIAAEGGANRSAFWTSYVLASIQDSLAKEKINFGDNIFAYSGVSGGSVGLTLFRSMHETMKTTNHKDSSYKKRVEALFDYDYLAGITSKMVFSDMFQKFLPVPVEMLDRTRALETDFENRWEEVFTDIAPGKNYLQRYISESKKKADSASLIFLNSTVVETGQRAIAANCSITDSIFCQAKAVNESLEGSIRYSSAMISSARFPYITPAARIENRDHEPIFHLVDGGYYENNGTITIQEVIQTLEQAGRLAGRKILILQITNDTEEKAIVPLNFVNEVTEPMVALLNTRPAHTSHHKEIFKTYSYKKRPNYTFDYIQLNMPYSMKEVAMNWYLSNASKNNIKKCAGSILEDKFAEVKGVMVNSKGK